MVAAVLLLRGSLLGFLGSVMGVRFVTGVCCVVIHRKTPPGGRGTVNKASLLIYYTILYP
jgi:hypothetical protein